MPGGVHTAPQPLLEIHADPLFPGGLRPLSAPVRLFEFQLASPPMRNGRAMLPAPIVHSGTAHAIIVWWQSTIDEAGDEMLSTAPCWVTEAADGAAAGAGACGGPAQQWRVRYRLTSSLNILGLLPTLGTPPPPFVMRYLLMT